MPIAKYFATVGSALVAMLFVANWYFPEPPVAFPDQPIEKTTIRIKSARKWPEKIVFNTSQPMPLVGDIPAAEQLAPPVPDDDTGRSAVEALAQLKQLPRLTSASRVRAAHKVARGHRSTNVVVLPMTRIETLIEHGYLDRAKADDDRTVGKAISKWLVFSSGRPWEE